MTPKELSTALSVSKGAVTGITTRLVSSGLVHRVEHPQDRRSLHLELTAAGHDATRTMHRDLRRCSRPTGPTSATTIWRRRRRCSTASPGGSTPTPATPADASRTTPASTRRSPVRRLREFTSAPV
ncbi:MarR family transcriptional regulator [Rathayibacter oskolensis]|uniref:MarR family transcriptional regulator n=1 Tax=Rathayibacter oskolensis TaxID=1891671 RepID=UPI00265E43E8|nr:MarR family transcriptional regulator [Rathayibacter oskolensis]WKK71005.1 MarR family transcriptional regulator [Rathayibacter oskolensis]